MRVQSLHRRGRHGRDGLPARGTGPHSADEPPTKEQLALIREVIDPKRLLLAHEPRGARRGGGVMSGPLEGIRVLDLCRFIAGPFCAQMLGDMGAEVIKVERPGGEDARHHEPFFEGESVYTMVFNRNKRASRSTRGTRRRCASSRRSSRVPMSWSRTSGPERSPRWDSATTACASSTRASSSRRSPASARPGRSRSGRSSMRSPRRCRA